MKILAPLILLCSLLNAPSAMAWLRTPACVYPDARNHAAPAWICESAPQRGLVTAVGYASRSTAGFSFSRSMAVADARIKLGQRLRGQCGKAGMSHAILENSRVLNLQRSPSGGFYARVGVRASDLSRAC
jgi:succinate dehydrogenase/fumarate reductase flavoprotein subunit